MKVININTRKRMEFIEITDEVRKLVAAEKIKEGMVFLYVPHTTAGLTINENADPAVRNDIMRKISEIVPEGDGYTHGEGNADSHIKSSVFGNELFFL